MYITAPLFKQNPSRLFKKLLKNRRTLRPTDYGIPEELRESNTPIYEAVKFARQLPPFDYKQYVPHREKELQSEEAYISTKVTRLTEGALQAQLLTNAVFEDQLPKSYQESLAATTVPDEELAKFEQSLFVAENEAHQESLPITSPMDKPWCNNPRQYGRGEVRTREYLTFLLNDFVRLVCPNKLAMKPLAEKLECQYLRPGQPIRVYEGKCSYATLTKKALAPISDDAPIAPLPTMYPAVPEMDLKKTLDYQPITQAPMKLVDNGYHLHTIHVDHAYNTIYRNHDQHRNWKSRELLGLAIMQTYAFAASTATVSQGIQKSVLQCVYHNLEEIGFVVFQLNNLDLMKEGEESARNQIWAVSMPLQNSEGFTNKEVLRHLKLFYNR